MSRTTSAADDVMKLLDRGDLVVLRKNGLGSYTAVSVRAGPPAVDDLDAAVDRALGYDPDGQEFGDNMPGVVDTDDFTPAQALYRPAEKATAGRIAPG